VLEADKIDHLHPRDPLKKLDSTHQQMILSGHRRPPSRTHEGHSSSRNDVGAGDSVDRRSSVFVLSSRKSDNPDSKSKLKSESSVEILRATVESFRSELEATKNKLRLHDLLSRQKIRELQTTIHRLRADSDSGEHKENPDLPRTPLSKAESSQSSKTKSSAVTKNPPPQLPAMPSLSQASNPRVRLEDHMRDLNKKRGKKDPPKLTDPQPPPPEANNPLASINPFHHTEGAEAGASTASTKNDPSPHKSNLAEFDFPEPGLELENEGDEGQPGETITPIPGQVPGYQHQLFRVASNKDDFMQSIPPEEESSSDALSETTLIAALKKLNLRKREKHELKLWMNRFTALFYYADEDGNGRISHKEYTHMLKNLHISSKLKQHLADEFSTIDSDGSGEIDLYEFLLFFLKSPMFKEEIHHNINDNAPYGQADMEVLSCCQWTRQMLYKIVEEPGYNTVSKAVFLLDMLFMLVPLLTLCVQGVRPGSDLDWKLIEFEWVINMYFASEYIIGVVTSKRKWRYVKSLWHIVDLASWLPWILFNVAVDPGKMSPLAFVVFRSLRLLQIHKVLRFVEFQQNLQVYIDTLVLAYYSYATLSGVLVFLVTIFSMLFYATERGEWDDDLQMWIRSDSDDGPSPFSNLYNCFYFTIVTMTTLGYGDYAPKSFLGKLIAIFTVMVGLLNLTFLINVIGECFEEVFKDFIEAKVAKIEHDRPRYMEKYIHQSLDLLQQLQDGQSEKQRRKFRKRMLSEFFVEEKSSRKSMNDTRSFDPPLEVEANPPIEFDEEESGISNGQRARASSRSWRKKKSPRSRDTSPSIKRSFSISNKQLERSTTNLSIKRPSLRAYLQRTDSFINRLEAKLFARDKFLGPKKAPLSRAKLSRANSAPMTYERHGRGSRARRAEVELQAANNSRQPGTSPKEKKPRRGRGQTLERTGIESHLELARQRSGSAKDPLGLDDSIDAIEQNMDSMARYEFEDILGRETAKDGPDVTTNL